MANNYVNVNFCAYVCLPLYADTEMEWMTKRLRKYNK